VSDKIAKKKYFTFISFVFVSDYCLLF